MQFAVADRLEIEQGAILRIPYVLISISDPDKLRPKPKKTHLCRAVMFLRFHDAEPSAGFELPANIRLMTARQARQVWDFVLRWKGEVRAIVVHCEAGMSRSPAVAAAICKGLGEDDSRFWREYQPNQFVYDLLLRTMPTES
jgi:predicted protein tyrosine phosphatase